MRVNAGVVIDLGNSETRVRTLLDNKTISKDVISNRLVILGGGYDIPVEYVTKGTTVIKQGTIHYAIGELAEREFPNKINRPSSLQKKVEQVTTEVSVKLAIHKAMVRISERLAKPIKEIDYVFDISILLPPLEHDTDALVMRDLVKQQTEINVLVPSNQQVKKEVEIASVQVKPEGMVSFFAVCFEETEEGMIDRLENKEFLTGTTLIIDIGAGTSDVSQVLDGELVESSKDTFTIGGNTIESMLKRDIRREYGFAPTNMLEIIKTGTLKEGVESHDIVPLLDKAKRAYAETALGHIREYAEGMSINMREVKGILVVGGGSKPAERDGQIVSPPVSEFLLDYLKEIAPNIRLVNTLGLDPRQLNIQGLEYIHKYL